VVCGAEALVRWQHPRRGLVSPGDFIPLAEETGLIVSIGEWVLHEACRQARVWQTEYPAAQRFTMNVNLSGKQLQRRDLAETVARILRQTGLDPSSLTLEITESVAMEDADSTLTNLRELKRLGVQIAMDDFGTGYSSLSYLKRFPVDQVKIDRSFVDGLGHDSDDTAIVRAVVTLARALNLQVTAEGIERPDQLAHLRSLGCERGQGYLFARPAPAEALTRLLYGEAHDAQAA
jgi:EAL domain-containing protein (putative c-di-GMP-specific phosphodiesterase class I)